MGVTITGQAGFDKFVSETRKFSRDLTSKVFEEKLLRKVCTEASMFLQKEYSNIDSTQQRPIVDVLYQGTRNATIIADGEDVMFIEFGTGTRGENSGYPSAMLPTNGVPITGSWIYNYDSGAKIHASNGMIMWRVPDQADWGSTYVTQNGLTRGIPAHYQFVNMNAYITANINKWFEEIVRTYYV